jgi:hypothetical protein
VAGYARQYSSGNFSESDHVVQSDLGIVLGGTGDQRKLFFPELMCSASDQDADHWVARISLSAPAGIFEVLDGASLAPQFFITGGIHDLDDPDYIANSKWRA